MDYVFKPIPDVEPSLVSLKFVGYVYALCSRNSIESNLFCKSKLVNESIFYSHIYFNIGLVTKQCHNI